MADTHAGSSECDLENALAKLKVGDRVYITFQDHADNHSPTGEPPNEFDEAGKLEMARLAAAYGCKPLQVDEESRIYFSKS